MDASWSKILFYVMVVFLALPAIARIERRFLPPKQKRPFYWLEID